jgi:hypothetical protein
MTYRLHHTWGLDPLPDLDGEQWIAMLPPLLRAWLGADGKPKPDWPRPDRRAAVERQLRRAEAQAEELRRQIASLPAQPNDDHGESADLAERGRRRLSSGLTETR